MKFEVFWTDCEGQECSLLCESRETAEGFAQWCHELGDTNIRIEEMNNE